MGVPVEEPKKLVSLPILTALTSRRFGPEVTGIRNLFYVHSFIDLYMELAYPLTVYVPPVPAIFSLTNHLIEIPRLLLTRTRVIFKKIVLSAGLLRMDGL